MNVGAASRRAESPASGLMQVWQGGWKTANRALGAQAVRAAQTTSLIVDERGWTALCMRAGTWASKQHSGSKATDSRVCGSTAARTIRVKVIELLVRQLPWPVHLHLPVQAVPFHKFVRELHPKRPHGVGPAQAVNRDVLITEVRHRLLGQLGNRRHGGQQERLRAAVNTRGSRRARHVARWPARHSSTRTLEQLGCCSSAVRACDAAARAVWQVECMGPSSTEAKIRAARRIQRSWCARGTAAERLCSFATSKLTLNV